MRKSLVEVNELPVWELLAWRDFFDVYGPLDWRREDYRAAAALQIQTAGKTKLKELVLFQEPESEATRRARSEEETLAAFGYVEK